MTLTRDCKLCVHYWACLETKTGTWYLETDTCNDYREARP